MYLQRVSHFVKGFFLHVTGRFNKIIYLKKNFTVSQKKLNRMFLAMFYYFKI